MKRKNRKKRVVEPEWICSHLSQKQILWSSNPELVKPTINTFLPTKPLEPNNVVNTWFVEDPTPSSLDESMYQDEIMSAATIIKNASGVLVIAGAGIGVDSGLPDYRGPTGFWKAYPQLLKHGLSLEEMSHPDWFQKDPRTAWGFYAHRARLYLSALPHEGFQSLKNIVEKTNNYFIFTSNIDGQFTAGNFDKNKLFEAHGSLCNLQCTKASCPNVWECPLSEFPEVDENLIAVGELPMCSNCGSLARPNVSMFGDTTLTWKNKHAENQKNNFMVWIKENGMIIDSNDENDESQSNRENKKKRAIRKQQKCDGYIVIIEIGCGVSLHSLRLETEMLQLMNGKDKVKVVRINPHDTKNSLEPLQRNDGSRAENINIVSVKLGAKVGLIRLSENICKM